MGLYIVVRGRPAPQGSKSARSICRQDATLCRRCGRRHLVKINQVEVSPTVKDWRQVVTVKARNTAVRSGWRMLEGDVAASFVFTFARPKGHYRTGRFAHLLRDDAPAFPGHSFGDLSKLIRAGEDAITDAQIWHDDSQVAWYGPSGKFYARPGAVAWDLGTLTPDKLRPGDDVLPWPGAVIRVWDLRELSP